MSGMSGDLDMLSSKICHRGKQSYKPTQVTKVLITFCWSWSWPKLFATLQDVRLTNKELLLLNHKAVDL